MVSDFGCGVKQRNGACSTGAKILEKALRPDHESTLVRHSVTALFHMRIRSVILKIQQYHMNEAEEIPSQ